RALPWYSDGYRVFDADGIEVANTFTPELALGSAKAVAKDIVEAANAHYGGKDAARIAELERKLKRAHDTMADLHRDWTREEARAEDAEARVSELEEKLSEAGRRFAWASDANERFEVRIWEEQKRAEAAEARLKDVDGDRWKLLLRAEDADAEVHDLQVRAKKAEADLSYYKAASENFEDSYWEANKRAEAAEKRAEQA